LGGGAIGIAAMGVLAAGSVASVRLVPELQKETKNTWKDYLQPG
jgi:hypothetical protein